MIYQNLKQIKTIKKNPIKKNSIFYFKKTLSIDFLNNLKDMNVFDILIILIESHNQFYICLEMWML